jgi:hypothetical protein
MRALDPAARSIPLRCRRGSSGRKRRIRAVLLVVDAGDDAVRTDADEGDDGRAPTLDFGFESLAAGAKFVQGQFIGPGGHALDDVCDAEFEVEKEGILKRGAATRREAAIVEDAVRNERFRLVANWTEIC